MGFCGKKASMWLDGPYRTLINAMISFQKYDNFNLYLIVYYLLSAIQVSLTHAQRVHYIRNISHFAWLVSISW